MTAIQEPAIKNTPFDDLIADFNKIRSLYTVEEPLETFKLIIEQEVMVSLILEAYSKIRELFPAERLGLEVKTDPEIANWRSLWITIYTKLEVEEAFEKLKTLDRTWWLDASLVIPNNILNIDLGWE
ncbi:peptidase [Microcoleus sp. herbarium7]|uniref:peptidase n=1 Tax=Microcoleus sp. herbarium7 TaxID=3055435 RepID=UPI002FD68F04